MPTHRGSVRSTLGLGPTMTANLVFFIIHKIFSCLWTTVRAGPGAVAPLATLKRRICLHILENVNIQHMLSLNL